jgi:O-antigen ligase
VELAAEDRLVLAAVLALPWAFGGVEIWAYRGAALLLVAGAALALGKEGWEGLGLTRRARWLLPALLLGLWALVQVVPIPPAALAAVSPRADTLYRESFPGYPGPAPADLAGALERLALERVPEIEGLPRPDRSETPFERRPGGRWSGWRSLSVFPSAGIERLFWYVALLLGFLVARRRCMNVAVARHYRTALFVNFALLALFGLIYAATSNGKLYWIRSPLQDSNPLGPYVNPNNFAAAMELGAPWLAGAAIVALGAWRRSGDLGPRAPLLVAATLLCGLAVLASASKSSPVLLATCLLTLGLVTARGWGRKLAVLTAGAAAGGLAALLLQGTKLAERVRLYLDVTGGDPTRGGRLYGWRSALDMLGDYPWTGSGFGSFRDVFPHYTPAGDHERWVQLHNDYLEVLVEGGVIAGVLLVWLVWGLARRIFSSRVLRGPDGIDPEGLGLTLGLVALALHATFDFNHQIPANALLFTTLAAIAVARYDGAAEIPGGRTAA